MKRFIPYGHQCISKDDIDAVAEVLNSDWLTQGPAIEKFERAVADYCEANYAVAVNSATSALHIACIASGLSPGDILWTSPITFVASANCALYCGATVDFVDIEPSFYNLSVHQLEVKLEESRKNGKLPKVIVPVHFTGQSCDMKRISQLSEKFGFRVVEDASHAIGGTYLGRKIGSCSFSDMTVFSFHPVKIITTGEGGMVLTNRKDFYERLRRLRSHGITRDPELMDGEPDGPWYYQQIELGYNYRLTDIQAALGLSQMKRLDEFVQRRNFLAKRYNSYLKDLPVDLPKQYSDAYSSYHLYVIRLKLKEIKKTHRQVFEELQSFGIGVNVHYIPVHTQPYFRKFGFKFGDFPEAEKFYSEAISLPIYFGLTDLQQNFVSDAIKKVLC